MLELNGRGFQMGGDNRHRRIVDESKRGRRGIGYRQVNSEAKVGFVIVYLPREGMSQQWWKP